MGPLKAASLALAVCLVQGVQGEARACDSYADEASLASVLARAVAEAQANGGLWAQASDRLPADATPESPHLVRGVAAPSPAGAGELGLDQPRPAAPAARAG
jgi:hypothetical protein